jgi:hypothetical protein
MKTIAVFTKYYEDGHRESRLAPEKDFDYPGWGAPDEETFEGEGFLGEYKFFGDSEGAQWFVDLQNSKGKKE